MGGWQLRSLSRVPERKDSVSSFLFSLEEIFVDNCDFATCCGARRGEVALVKQFEGADECIGCVVGEVGFFAGEGKDLG